MHMPTEMVMYYRCLPPAQSVSAKIVAAAMVKVPAWWTLPGEFCSSVTKGVILGGIVIASVDC